MAQDMGYFPDYPERISAVAKELRLASDDLSYSNQKMNDLANKCSCSNAISVCLPQISGGAGSSNSCLGGSLGVVGNPCQNESQIEQTQEHISDKIDQISYLRELLKAEMASGLDDELKTLRKEDADALKKDLDNLLASSQSLISSADKNSAVLDNPKYSANNQCSPECGEGFSLGLKACLLKGEQGKINLKFKVGVALDDLDLGSIGVKSVSLHLPDKISIGGLDNLGELRIPMPDAVIDFPDVSLNRKTFSMEPIAIHPPTLKMPTFPLGNYSCPSIQNYSSYSCGGPGAESQNSYTDLNWDLETFSFLSEKCQSLPKENDDEMIDQNQMQKCLDKDDVQKYILQRCDNIWEEYSACLLGIFKNCEPPPDICQIVKRQSDRSDAASEQCSALFRQMGEPVPANCNLTSLENECESVRENDQPENVPEACLYLPLFTEKMPNQETQNFQENSSYCNAQSITDISGINFGADCPLPLSGQVDFKPLLKLPSIKIPDVKLPTFSFMPFVKVKLPNFIFEDLNFDLMPFCNFQQCLDLLPPLNLDVPYPTLRIPPIDVPSRSISIPTGLSIGDIPVSISMDKIEFPPIPIPIPQIDLLKLASLNLDLPKIQLPQPKVTLDFEGLDVDPFNILLGLVSALVDIPSGCIGGGIHFIPLIISFPDYYFYWPRFLDNLDLCNNKYVSVNSFCSSLKDSLYPGINAKMSKIQNALNGAYRQIQTPLDQASKVLYNIIEVKINHALDNAEAKIKSEAPQKIQEYLAKKAQDIDTSSILSIQLNDIVITPQDLGPVNSILQNIPAQIRINWPEEVKQFDLSKYTSFQLPKIDLSSLSYEKELTLPLPWLQLSSFRLDLSNFTDYPSCTGGEPSGGNPYPMGEMQQYENNINSYNKEINNSMQDISNILD